MTHMTRAIAMVAVMLLALPAATALGQDSSEESVLDNPGQLEGIEYGVSREWSTTADPSTPPADGESMVYLLAAAIFEFDTNDNAETAFDVLRDDLTGYISETFGLSSDDFTTEEGDNDEFIAHGELAQGDERAYFKYVLDQEGAYVFVALSATSDEASSQVAEDLSQDMVDQDDDLSGLGEFNEDGTSTGGLWDFMPASDDDLVADLEVSGDTIVFPEDEEAA